MAKGQQQGTTALMVWMIVFVVFWLASTVWLVVLYTGQEDLRKRNAELAREARQLATPDERSSIELIKNLSDSGPTAVGLLEEARATTAELASGEPTDAVATIRTKRDELLRTIRDDGLVESSGGFADASFLQAMRLLYEQFKKVHEARKAAEARVAELESDLGRHVKLTSDQKAELDKIAQEISDQLASVESSRNAYRTERDEALATLEKQFERQKAQGDAELTTERQRRSQAEDRLEKLQTRVKALQEKYGSLAGPAELGPARVPDGVVLTAIPGDDVVYIDLGSDEHVILGMEFAVYPADNGIPADGVPKARIEVVSVSATSAECVIRMVAANSAIIEGDLVANPIYERDRSPTFIVLGDFDLDRDGAADADGRRTVESLITKWGGSIGIELSPFTDFVVAGGAPPKPRTPKNPTAEQTALAERQQQAWDAYQTLLGEAQSLSVPIMTQEVFLNFLGWTVRAPRR